MGKVKDRLSAKVDALAGSVAAHRRDINQLNRRIDNLVELVTEVDKRLDDVLRKCDNSNNSNNPYIDHEHPRA